MRYSSKHKEESRMRLIESGAALAKQNGFANTGMDKLTAAAGVTTGAFYTQFRSKPEFLHAIIEHEMSKVLSSFEGRTKAELLAALRNYLSKANVNHPELGCPVPSLGAEVARADIATRKTFEKLILRYQAAIANEVHDDATAWTMGCAAVGAVLIARAMVTPEHRNEVLRSVFDFVARTLDDGDTPR